MTTRFNVAYIPIKTNSDKYIFDTGIKTKFFISGIEKLLFDKLSDRLKQSHPSGLFSAWGIGSGERSVHANNWNKLNSNDLLLFCLNNDSVLIAKVAQKIQSENVAKYIWPEDTNSEVSQYVITVNETLPTELPISLYFAKSFFNKLSKLNTFEVFEDVALSEIFSDKFFSDVLFRDFVTSLEDVESDYANFDSLSHIENGQSESSSTDSLSLSSAERKVIEMHAVNLAKEHFKVKGYSKIEDVGSFESFDLRVQKGNKILYVEVKGTTLNGDSIVLTRNEVELHAQVFPNNALFLVTQIQLHKGTNLKASGGIVKVISPWKIFEENLSVIAFNYRV